jgi:ABC-type antimicrobial peptide transport system permease subunit
MLIASFAGVALLLAAIGVSGAVSYAVQARTREFGVRLAFGARPGQLIASALWQAGQVGGLGGLIGLAAVVILARLAGDSLYLVPRSHTGILFGVSMTDPAVLLAAFTGVVAVVIAAAAFPARRVTTVDPVQALRAD